MFHEVKLFGKQCFSFWIGFFTKSIGYEIFRTFSPVSNGHKIISKIDTNFQHNKKFFVQKGKNFANVATDENVIKNFKCKLIA